MKKAKVRYSLEDKIINAEVYSAFLEAKLDDEFFIPRLVKHRIETCDSLVRILEISYGIFDEKDIFRLEDIYERR